MKATPEQQQQLLVLADIDEEIRLLQHRRAHLPEQQVLDTHIETQKLVTEELADATQTKDRLAVQSTRHEREIETVDTGRKSHEAQIYSGRITNDRELEAIRAEIAAMKRRKGDLEDSLLEIMEQLEEVTSLVEELSRRRSELDEQIIDLTTRRDDAAKDIDGELATLSERRAAESAAIPEDIVGVYEGLRAKRKGRVVARLENRTCTGCHMELTTIELEEIKETAASALARCDQCGSIIVPA